MSGLFSKFQKELSEIPVLHCKWAPECKRKFTLKFLLENHEKLCPHEKITPIPQATPSSTTMADTTPTVFMTPSPTPTVFMPLSPTPTVFMTPPPTPASNIKIGQKRRSVPSGAPAKKFLCKNYSVCHKSYETKDSKSRHERLCGLSEQDKQTFLKAKFGNDPRHVCIGCGKVFVQTIEKSQHEDGCAFNEEQLRIKYVDDPTHFCSNCDRFFVDPGNCQKHERSCGVTMEEMMIRMSDDPTHFCSKCDLFFVQAQNCQVHESRCGVTKEEMMIRHANDPSHWCEECGHKFFSRPEKLMRHRLQYHTQIDVMQMTPEQMKYVHPLNYDKTAIGEEATLDPSHDDFDALIKRKLEWADTFAAASREENFVYRAGILGHSFSATNSSYATFISAHPDQMGVYSGVKQKHLGVDIQSWHKKKPQDSKPGQAALRGQEVVFLGQTGFEGEESAMQARKQEALEINYGYYSNQYQGQKMYYINSERELANLYQNSDADLVKMLYKAVRGDPIFCSDTDCKCEAYFHYDLEKVTKVDFQLAAGQVSKSPPPPLPRQRPRPSNPTAIQIEVDRLFRTLKEEMGLVLAIPFNVYSVLLVKKADFPGLSDPRAVINALLGTTREIVAWLYTGKGVEAEDGGIHQHHFYGFSTIKNELANGDKIAIQIARMRCKSQQDAEEKEAFVLYASQLSALSEEG
ncbi:uncharacterized protein LOC110860503 isoform X1 [Folsomia candida]|uniref:uncharacterized protein LOC110860503 isoform X1 n=1 Tax=Folsomia candida TaxID=158441 RepID=UPI000B8F8BFA|nr:uncharacterized protein LOC110860503 isoform X1 [Folsomia candida]